MDMLKQLNNAIIYIEENLCNEIDIERVAKIACVTKASFVRFFSYMTGMTLNEYIRRRRLTLAAIELQNSNLKVIDIAVKYGWESADSFTKAFVRQHGITPTLARNSLQSLKIYPPASFYIIIKGAKKMDLRFIELEETAVYGVSKQFDGQKYKTREELRHIMWADNCDDVPNQICNGKWNTSGTHFDGMWYGVWQDGKYMIARKKKDIMNDNLEKTIIPAGLYAAFKTEIGSLAWDELLKLFDLIFESWLPNSKYKLRNYIIIEIYHLWTDKAIRSKNRYYEVLIPIEEK